MSRVQSVLCDISIETYCAADNPFDVVERPERCRGCESEGSFHRHGTYERYIEETRRKVARFICARCRLTVSVLPAFVLPYRPRLLADAERYFAAGDAERANVSHADTLRRYWRQWCIWYVQFQMRTCWPPGGAAAREPRAYWRQLHAWRELARTQAQAVSRYGLSILRRYACHQVPARLRNC